jgi:hypothetical protein
MKTLNFLALLFRLLDENDAHTYLRVQEISETFNDPFVAAAGLCSRLTHAAAAHTERAGRRQYGG